jgi:hypothetical protein
MHWSSRKVSVFVSLFESDGAFRLRDRSATIATIAAPVFLRSDEVEHCSTSGASQRSRPRYSQSEIKTWIGMNIIINIIECTAL